MKVDKDIKKVIGIKCRVIIEELLLPGCNGSKNKNEVVNENVGVFNGNIVSVVSSGDIIEPIKYHGCDVGDPSIICADPNGRITTNVCVGPPNDCLDYGSWSV